MAKTTQEKFSEFVQRYEKIQHVTQVAALLEWDEQVCMPPGGAEARGKQLAYIHTHAHVLATDPSYVALIEELNESKKDLSPAERAAVELTLTKTRRRTRVPAALVEKIAHTNSKGFNLWQKAKKEKSFKMFAPALAETIQLKKEFAECVKEPGQTPYDALAADYEAKISVSKMTDVLGALKRELVPFVAERIERQKKSPPAAESMPLSNEAQDRLNRWALEKIGYNFNEGRLDIAAHPFCTTVGDDIRITTRYNADYWPSSFYGIMHEGGHAIYEQGVLRGKAVLPIREATGLGMHESQSRFWENNIGRSRPFCEFLFANVPSEFRSALGKDVETLYRNLNTSEKSYIRVEADEFTYNLHIMIRFELEQAIFSGKIKPAELRDAWNDKVKEVLDLPAPTDDLGVLQDVHWPVGAMGYFPTYTIGNLIAAQLTDKMASEMKLDEIVRKGEFSTIREWLYEKIHRFGAEKPTLELLESATGKSLSHEPLMRYLKSK